MMCTPDENNLCNAAEQPIREEAYHKDLYSQ